MSNQVVINNADPLEVDSKLDRAGRINSYHRLSREAGRVSIAAAIAAGVELEMAMAELPAGQFEQFVAAQCEFGRRTAYHYRAAARAVLGEALDQLIETSNDRRRQAVEAAASSIDSATLTDLYVEAGIVKRAPSHMGGRRPGAGRKPKTLQEEVDEIAKDPDLSMDEARGLLAKLYEFGISRNGWDLLRDEDLAKVCSMLRQLLKTSEDILKTRGGR